MTPESTTLGESKTEYLKDIFGGTELGVDGSSVSIEFTHTVPDGFSFHVERVGFVLIASGSMNAHRFGTRSELPIGVDFEMILDGRTVDLLSGIDLVRNGDFGKLAGSEVSMIGNNRGMAADMDWGKRPLRLSPGTVILARINDNLSSLTSFTISLNGRMVDIVTEV